MVIKSTPQILKRISLRWVPGDAFEDTETIALNVNGWFMDLRVVLADASLQWSRAGERRKLKDDPLTFQWTRVIDSTGSAQPDEAHFKELPNGDDLEYGTFPKDGTTPVPYEEIWRDVTEVDAKQSAWILQSVQDNTFLGRVGGIFLGMRQEQDHSFGVRKEVYNASEKVWKVVFETGPTGEVLQAIEVIKQLEPVVRSKGITAGEEVVLSGRTYVVRGFEAAP
ncbi:hypothetical protein CONLIGDRAFT_672557 [Coniochaeta ligniaria NRRL 30616]|uniref:Protein HRI1 n=1 Tax=Coniochaeta ligniaria NRRL 30616 TaxID=1408157 RepID=A0A1J7IWR9_9PEZI|nr:hypothetical protein CONLIGDRAFT_672557 [Coniochaeta ligniaria NRRL 30616]